MNGFEEGAILASDDGISYQKEIKVESKTESEEEKARKRAQQQPKRVGTLAQQLEENKALQDAEWKAKHNPFRKRFCVCEGLSSTEGFGV